MSGFYCRNFIFIGTGGGNKDYVNQICKGCAKALIRCGWRLDSRHTDIDDIKVYDNGDSYTRSCWYYLRSKTDGGAKLLVFYNYYYRTNVVQQSWGNSGRNSGDRCVSDLCLAMIPAGSTSEFGDTLDGEEHKFIPDDATYLCGKCYDYGYLESVAFSNHSGVQYEWTFLSNGEDYVSMYTKLGSDTGMAFTMGRLIGTLAYPDTDTSVSARYSVVQMTSSTTEMTGTTLTGLDFPNSTSSNVLLGHNRSTFVFLPDGSRYQFGGSTSSQNCNIFAEPSIGNKYVCSSYNNGQRRWTPIGIAICNSVPSSGQVIHGADGFKGFLDTDRIRFVGDNDIQREQLLDNGNFLHAHGGIAHAWDSSNILQLTYPNSEIDVRNWDGGADPFA